MENNTETKTTKTEKTRSKASLKLAEIKEMAQARGLEARELKAYVHYGFKGGVQVSVANNEDVGRVYIYRTHLEHPAVTNFSEEQRKAERLGGVFAEIEFDCDEAAVREAVALALDAVASAEAPVKAEPKPKAERKPRAKKAEAAPAESTETVVEQATA